MQCSLSHVCMYQCHQCIISEHFAMLTSVPLRFGLGSPHEWTEQ